jgi:hypothetical protein
MCPETLIRVSLVLPVDVHVIQEVCGALGTKNLGDVGVGTGRVAVLGVASSTVVGPETMNSPLVSRASGRVLRKEISLFKYRM